ncbi:MAG: translational machinery protein [Proteobacteria bacterium]|nr:translational machinery protein [Pseudomonadota bacterium]
MSHFHAVAWLDHTEAHVMHIAKDDVEKFTARASDRHPHLHHKRGSIGPGNRAGDAAYFDAVVKLLGDAQEVLIVGPGSAKLELIKHIHKHHAGLVGRVLGVESVDHPTDAQVVAHARSYFAAKDQMLGKGGLER